MLRACGRRGRQARRRRNRQGSPSQHGHPGCLECPLINMWKRLFSSCFGDIESESEDAVEDGWPTEQERAIGGEELISDGFGTASSMSSSLGANGGTDRDTSGPRYPSPLHHGGPRSGVAVSTAGVGCGGGGSVTQGRSPPAETTTAGAAAAARTISPSAPPFIPTANGVPAPALASSSFAAMRPSAAVSPPTSTADTVRSQNKSSLRATAPEWRPAAFFAPTASTAVAPTTAPASCSVPSHIATGTGPHHMGAVPPHLMGGAPHGPTQPQQYPLFWTASMGHHQQQPTLDQEQEAIPSAGVGMAGGGGNFFRGIESPGLTAETGISTGAAEQVGGNPFDMF